MQSANCARLNGKRMIVLYKRNVADQLCKELPIIDFGKKAARIAELWRRQQKRAVDRKGLYLHSLAPRS